MSTGTPRDPALAAVPRRARGGARPRGAALGAALARADDRPLRGAARRARRRAVRGRGLERHRGAAPALPHRRRSARATRSITSPFSFVASANCFIYEGATPVFADVDARTLNLDPAAVEAAITRADEGDRRGGHLRLPVRARPAARALRAARADADRGRLRGARRRVQGRARSARTARRRVFAFYPNKQMTTGEGGVVTTHDEERVAAAREPAQPGPRLRRRRWFHHVRLGFNYRWTDVQAAIGIAQLEKLDEILALRAERGRALRRAARRTSTASSRRSPTTPTTSAPGSSTS